MNIRTALFVTTSLLGALALAACDSGDGGTGGAGGDGTGGTGNTGNAGGSGGTGGTGGGTMDGWLRLGQFSPDSPALDFCVTGADGMARTSGYAAAGIAYPGAGEFVTLPAGTYAISLIGAGMDCSAPIETLPDYAIAAGSYQTLIVDGMQAALQADIIVDENAPAAGNVVLNACHENVGAPPVQIGTVDPATDTFTSLFNDGGATTFSFRDCYAQEVPAPVAMGTVLAVSANGVDVDGRWTVPVDLATGGASIWIYGTDATDMGAYACINVGAGTCTALPVAN